MMSCSTSLAFSPVKRVTLIYYILVIVVYMDLEFYQMDVRIVFLNGELDEDIYINQHLGFETKEQECKFYKLNRVIYGLKQASRQ